METESRIVQEMREILGIVSGAKESLGIDANNDTPASITLSRGQLQFLEVIIDTSISLQKATEDLSGSSS
jgi:hypothetical protein